MTITLKIQLDKDLTKEEQENLINALIAQVEDVNNLRRTEWRITNSVGKAVDGGDSCWFVF